MTPSDIGIFEALAAVFTLSFILLVFFIWRFIRNLDLARGRIQDATRRLAPGRLPARADPERGAVQFRIRGEGEPPQDDSQPTQGR